ncbi:hypothetical protein CFOL_v3_20041 [Cephalotus follicularis]|uniref:Uncharacterized protein n=1 Tax=Cephalotus follicularis TaxID=3775 RepID=A0A1Q3C8Z1_CEPFO|nr:hypothetical protein CFOL_v3_20041 [Cephalotus follicularis]
MEAAHGYTSENNSFHVRKAPNTNIVDFNKKRKLQAEQLGLPTPKHKFSNRSLLSELTSIFEGNPVTEGIHSVIQKGELEGGFIDDVSEPESAKDSNSFVDDSDSAMSVYGENKLEIEDTKPSSCDRPSSSSFTCGGSSVKDTCYSLDITAAVETGAENEEVRIVHEIEELDPSNDCKGCQVSWNLEDSPPGFECHVDCICSKYANVSVELAEKELEDALYSSGLNPNSYVHSFGRWSANRDAQQGTWKPTIDQEFEQYFSMLML